jgi:hypothetical protein
MAAKITQPCYPLFTGGVKYFNRHVIIKLAMQYLMAIE